MAVAFDDFSIQVKELVKETAVSFLYEAGGEVCSGAKINSRVDTGQTKNSYDYKVNEGSLSVDIGSPLENAIWEEFGTGIHAMNGDGRKTSWVYQDRQGVFHRTKGKTANRPLFRAFETSKERIIRRAEQLFGGLK